MDNQSNLILTYLQIYSLFSSYLLLLLLLLLLTTFPPTPDTVPVIMMSTIALRKGTHERKMISVPTCHSISVNCTEQSVVFLFSPLYPSLNIKLIVAFTISVPREKKANIPELLLLQISMTFFFLVFLCFFLCP